jgi:biotin carboxylase
MKKSFDKLGLNIPNYFLIKNLHDLKKNINYIKKAIIKPVDSRGARGVYVINKKENNLKKLFNNSIKYSPSKKLILEEFLEGPQLSTESIILNNKVLTVGVSDRNYEYLNRFKPHVIENGSDMPSKFEGKFLNKINNIIKKICLHLNIKNGTIKGDLVISNNKIFIIEAAIRLSGGYFSSHMIPHSSGINLIDLAIKIHLKKKLKLKRIKKKSFVTQRFLFTNPGKVKKIIIPKWIKNSKNIILFECNIKKGSFVKKITNHTDRIGQVIVKANSKNKAIKLAIKICNSVKIKNYSNS